MASNDGHRSRNGVIVVTADSSRESVSFTVQGAGDTVHVQKIGKSNQSPTTSTTTATTTCHRPPHAMCWISRTSPPQAVPRRVVCPQPRLLDWALQNARKRTARGVVCAWYGLVCRRDMSQCYLSTVLHRDTSLLFGSFDCVCLVSVLSDTDHATVTNKVAKSCRFQFPSCALLRFARVGVCGPVCSSVLKSW